MSVDKLKNPFLQFLTSEKKMRSDECEEVYDEHLRTGKSIREVILEMEFLDEEEYLEAVASHTGSEVVKLPSMLDSELVKDIPVGIARMYNVVPYNIEGDVVQLAVFDVPTPAAEDELMFVLSKNVRFVIARKEEIQDSIERHYGDSTGSVKDLLASLEEEMADAELLDMDDDASVIDPNSLRDAASATPIIRFVNLVLYQAVMDRASDIHFEPFEDDFKIRYRVDGALYEMAPPPQQLALPIISRVKVIADLDIAEHRLPQDGRIQLNIAGHMVDFRVSSLPTQFGESVVLRVLDKSNISLEMDDLGFPDDIMKNFSEDIEKPNGIIIVTGPTGSGKTTTLYAALQKINRIGSKLLTAEDPVEYDVGGLVQVPVNSGIGLTFASLLRSFLRQDPDVILVGEIRDIETVKIAIQASLTGHLVMSTLHTNDAPGAITRLIDMGAEPFLISATIDAVVGQRLVRTICSECREKYDPDQEILRRLGLEQKDIGDNKFYMGKGCAECNQTGYKGRRGIYEYLRISEPIRKLINNRESSVIIRNKAIELGMRTLREDGIRCILDGYTTADEILKYT